MVVNYQEILEAFEFVGFGSVYEHQAFLCKKTGKVYWQSEYSDELEELPDDIDSENYIEIPHKNELDLGKKLVIDFAYECLPNEVENVEGMFNKKGAYSKFKNFLESKGMLEQWYDYESKAQERALREWCKLNSIEVNG